MSLTKYVITDPEEFRSFDVPGRRVPRKIVLTGNTGEPERGANPVDLEDYVAAELKSSGLDKAGQLCGLCISVKDLDGMTWSAEMVLRRLMMERPHFTPCVVYPRSDNPELHAVADIVGSKAWLSSGVKAGLISGFMTDRSWFGPGIVAGVFVVGALLAFTTEMGTRILRGSTDPSQPILWVLLGIGALLALALRYLWDLALASTTEKRMAELNKAIEKNEMHEGFIAKLAEALRHDPFPRFVVVDGFSELDRLSQAVIEKYFAGFNAQSDGAEFWAIFERLEGAQLFQRLRLRNPGQARIRFLRQQLLDENERQELARVAGRSEDHAHNLVAGRVCLDIPPRLDGLAREALAHRTRHPTTAKGFGSLELLYLLSLTAIPGSPAFEPIRLRASLSAATRQKQMALAEFLGPGNYSEEAFAELLTVIRRDCSWSMIRTENGNFRILPDVAEMFEDRLGELELPDPGLGHVFWALHWYDAVRKGATHPSEVRRLTHHAVKLSMANASADLGGQLQGVLVDVRLLAFDACLRCGMYNRESQLFLGGDVISLLESAWLSLKQSPAALREEKAPALMRKLWEAHVVLGGQLPLQLLVEANPAKAEAAPAADWVASWPERIFAGELAAEHRELSQLGSIAASTVDARDLMTAHSGWIALTGAQLTEWPSRLDVAAADTLDRLPKISRTIFSRIAYRPKTAEAIDLAAVAYALWCRGLSFHVSMVDELGGTELIARFQSLVDFAETCLPKLAQLDTSFSEEAPLHLDFLAAGLAREAMLTAVAAVLTAVETLRRVKVLETDVEYREKLAGFLRAASAALRYPLGEYRGENSHELFRQVDELLKLNSVVWQTLQVDRMRDVVVLRRIQFSGICRRLPANSFYQSSELVEDAGPALTTDDSMGLLANWILADCVRSAAELGAHYRRAAAVLLCREGTPAPLEPEAILLSLRAGQVGTDGARMVERLLGAETEHPLRQHLGSLPAESICGQLLHLLNACESKAELAQRVAAEFEQLPLSPIVRREVESIVTLHLLEANELAPYAESEQRWEPWADLWTYAGMLSRYVRAGERTESLYDRCFALLREQHFDSYNTRFNLALDLANRGRLGPNKEAVNYLRSTVRFWESVASAEVNIQVYQLLIRNDAGRNTEDIRALTYWQNMKLERDHLREFPALMKQGRYFLIFEEYFSTLSVWGLQTTMDNESFVQRFYLPVQERLPELNRWMASGGTVPPAIVRGAGQTLIGADFLILGHYLFRIGNTDGMALHQEAFNRQAQAHLPLLLEAIVHLPGLPAGSRELLLRYRSRYQVQAAKGSAAGSVREV